MTCRRWRLPALLAALLVLVTVAGPALAAAPGTTGAASSTITPEAPSVDVVPSIQDNETETPTPTETPVADDGDDDEDGDGTAPPMAERARITPTKIQEADYLSVEVRESDEVFGTEGDVVVFEVSQPLEAVRIQQEQAEATVLQGGHVLKVEYQPGAAPPGNESLYRLELFFEDGSQGEVELYASETDKSVAASDLTEWEPVIDALCDLAETYGHDECTPAEMEEFIEFAEGRLEVIEGFLVEALSFVFFWLSTGLTHPATLTLMLAVAGLVLWRLYSKHGDILEELSTRANRYVQKRDKLESDFQSAKRTADDDDLREVPAIGSFATYWRDAYGVRSPLQLAHLAQAGAHRRVEVTPETDGGDADDAGSPQVRLERVHEGVDDLDLDAVEESWLEPVLRHLPNERVALNHIRAAITYLETEYQLGHAFEDAHVQVEMLLEDLDERDGRALGVDHGSSGSTVATDGGRPRGQGGTDAR